jgi:DNA-binding MarR family transcriptional regulator
MLSLIAAEHKVPMVGLLEVATEALFAEFNRDLAAAGFTDIRPTHGCAFRFIGPEGLRLTDLASLADITKQSAGEIVTDLERSGYVERIPDPADKRAKLIRLTKRGEEAQRHGFTLLAEIEERWAERYGADRIAALREALEALTVGELPSKVPELVADREPAPSAA